MELSLRGRHALLVEDGVFSHKIKYVSILKDILNHEGHSSKITDSRVTVIALNKWLLLICGASLLEALQSRELPSLV